MTVFEKLNEIFNNLHRTKLVKRSHYSVQNIFYTRLNFKNCIYASNYYGTVGSKHLNLYYLFNCIIMRYSLFNR